MTLLFNRSAAARILGIKPELIIRMELWASCVVVHIKGRRSTFVSKTKFYSEFARFRREGAAGCQVREFSAGCYPGSFDVLSDGQRWYHVRLNLGCSCPDYAQQRQLWGKGMCKHQYAVLNHLGASSLEDAMAKGRSETIALVRAKREALAAAEWRESAPLVKPPVKVIASRPLPAQFAHVSIV